MKKGPAHIYVAPLGLGRLASMLPTARAVGYTISPAAQADNSSNTPASNMTSLQAIVGFGNIETGKMWGAFAPHGLFLSCISLLKLYKDKAIVPNR